MTQILGLKMISSQEIMTINSNNKLKPNQKRKLEKKHQSQE